MRTGIEKRRLSTLKVHECDDPSQSLLLSLEAVLSAYGRCVPRDELAAALGDAFLLTYAAEARPGEQWNTYGRHAFLESAARLYGLELRDLHPPDAAPLPLPPPEFEDHFTDSYLPLVRTALDHEHPALAWMGWPAPQRAIWGVITDYDPSRGECLGRSIYSGGRTVALAAAPVQIYTVQEYRETTPPPPAIIDVALNRAAAVLADRLPVKYRVVTGVVALEKWRAAAMEDSGADWHSRLVQSFVTGRRRAVEFFRLHCGAASADQAAAVEQYAAIFEEQVQFLAPLARESNGPAELQKELPAVLDLIIALEQRGAAVIQ
ncbi:MAG TPA: hypothetical protein VJZ71_01165 [Phycisphaerae bacterium]|nr:hypothetical protein [Phycisphaerae bacterium]